jgi:NAD(P)-dependent dehydrogenase (short-subunit alcohol dehydrogenase family)
MGGRLSGKAAIITGAGGGLGRAMTGLFLAEGAMVVATDVAPAGLEAFAGLDGVAAVVGDVCRREAVEQLVGTATDRFGRLDILVNNAGIVDRFLPVAEMTDEVWQRVLAVNLTGPMMTSRAAIPVMLAQGGGCILNISSVAGLGGARAGAAYTASKHGLIGLTRNIAATYGRDGIRCVAICPGGIKTGISIGGEPSVRGQEALNRAAATSVRFAEPEEIAALSLFLVSDEASIVNGAVLAADAGWTAS